jgi:pimeloyl-ACP methyl ester carboxylesterase
MNSKLLLNVVEAGNGRPFVFQHGLCGDAAQAGEVFPADAGFRRITLECRGHGLSQPGDLSAFSIATFADDVAELIEARAIAPAVLGGISMGAAIALRLAVTRPDLVSALVLARPAWLVDAAPANMRPFGEVGDLLARLPADEARARFDRSATSAMLEREAPDNLASLRGFFTRSPQPVTASLLSRIAADGPGVTADQVAALKLPALVIGHGRDFLHPFDHAKRLAGLVPRARLVEITPKATNWDRYVVEFRAALQSFLIDLAALHGEPQGSTNRSGPKI